MDFVTFHGPVAVSAALDDANGETMRAMRRALTDPAHFGEIENPAGADTLSCVAPGVGRGELVGGNLTLLATTLGTAAEVETRGKIVLLEEIDEEPYSVDRLLNHLLNAGKLADGAGILLGEFTNCEPPARYSARGVAAVVRDVLAPLGIPIIAGLCVGHGRVNLTLPLGAQVEVDAEAKRIRVCAADRI